MNQTWTKFLPSFIRARVEGRYNLQKIAENIGWLITDKILSMGVGLFVGVLVARYLGPERLGFLSYSVAFVGLFTPLAQLGLANIVVRDLVREPLHKYEILGTAFGIQFVSGLLTVVVIFVVSMYLNADDYLTQLLIFISAFGLIFQSFNIVDYWFQSRTEAKYVVIARRSAFFITAIIKGILVIFQAPLVAFVGVITLEFLLVACGFFIIYRISGEYFKKWQFRLGRAKRLLSESLPLFFSAITVVIYLRIDTIMLGQMADKEAVGLYAVAVRFSEVWYFIPGIFTLSLFPAIIRARDHQNKLDYLRKMQIFYDGMAGLSYLIIIPVFFTSSMLVAVLYGNQYLQAGQILSIHVWSLIFVALGAARGKWLVAENLGNLYFITTALGALVNVCLNILLIPRYAGVGAAWATLVAYATAAYLSCLLFKVTRPVFVQMSLSLLIILRLFFLKDVLHEIYKSIRLENLK